MHTSSLPDISDTSPESLISPVLQFEGAVTIPASRMNAIIHIAVQNARMLHINITLAND